MKQDREREETGDTDKEANKIATIIPSLDGVNESWHTHLVDVCLLPSLPPAWCGWCVDLLRRRGSEVFVGISVPGREKAVRLHKVPDLVELRHRNVLERTQLAALRVRIVAGAVHGLHEDLEGVAEQLDLLLLHLGLAVLGLVVHDVHEVGVAEPGLVQIVLRGRRGRGRILLWHWSWR